MISQETIEEIRSRVRLRDLIGESQTLKMQGGGYVCLCPFHSENTPSFHIREDENRYHCFGCGVSGDSITYVMETQGLPFPEAVQHLADRIGIEIEYVGPSPNQKHSADKKALFSVNKLAWEYFVGQLRGAESNILRYLDERQLSTETVGKFGVGYAPPAWNGLVKFLKAKKIPDELLLTAGLVRRSSKGELYDTFRGRLVFPVRIDSNRVAGFGGRVIPSLYDKETLPTIPKYLNSQETPVYNKSSILYGIPEAFRAIKSEGEAYVVEGYMDVAALNQAGVENVIATCGTAVTAQHISRLESMVRRIYLLFDGDLAGRKAAANAFKLFLNCEVDVMVLFLPDGEDPDSIAKSYLAKVREYLEGLERNSLLKCYINEFLAKFGYASAADIGPASKGKISKEIAEVLGGIKRKIPREESIKEAAYLLMVEASLLGELVDTPDNRLRQKEIQPNSDPGREEASSQNIRRKAIKDLPKTDQAILGIIMACKAKFTARVLKDSNLCASLDSSTLLFVEGYHEILEDERLSNEEKKKNIHDLLVSFGESWIGHWKNAYLMLEDDTVDMQKAFEECCHTIRKNSFRRAIKENEKRLMAVTSEAEREALLKEQVDLARKINY